MYTNSDTVASGGTVSTSVVRIELRGRVKRCSRWPSRLDRWYSVTEDGPPTTWLTAAATRAGTTNAAAPVDSATNITAAIGAR